MIDERQALIDELTQERDHWEKAYRKLALENLTLISQTLEQPATSPNRDTLFRMRDPNNWDAGFVWTHSTAIANVNISQDWDIVEYEIIKRKPWVKP